MRHRELTDHIKGSFLKRQYLEAFLVQSAYIESLLKVYVDYSLFTATDTKTYKDKVLITVRKNFDKLGLSELIKFLHSAELISGDRKRLLDRYREKRNTMMHQLVNEISKPNFEEELESICKIGNEIIESDEFVTIADLIDKIEKPKEVTLPVPTGKS